MNNFIVTTEAMRPASSEKQCFYCKQPLGSEHKSDCVLVKKKIRISVTTELEVELPHHWTLENIEFFYNEGSWCAGNLADIIEANGCICGSTDIEALTTIGEAFLQEK